MAGVAVWVGHGVGHDPSDHVPHFGVHAFDDTGNGVGQSEPILHNRQLHAAVAKETARPGQGRYLASVKIAINEISEIITSHSVAPGEFVTGKNLGEHTEG